MRKVHLFNEFSVVLMLVNAVLHWCRTYSSSAVRANGVVIFPTGKCAQLAVGWLVVVGEELCVIL